MHLLRLVWWGRYACDGQCWCDVKPLVLLAQVPSSTPVLVQMYLDMLGTNKNLHPLPSQDMFKDASGEYTFRDRVAAYLQGMSTRACANIFTPHGGGAGSNNATESQNKVSHKQMPVRANHQAHVPQLLTHMQTISRSDSAFTDTFRSDIWHHDHFVAAEHLMNFVAFPGNPHACSINVMDLAYVEFLYIDRLDPAKMVYVHRPDNTPASRVMDMGAVMTQEKLACLMVPSYRTLQTLCAQHASLFECRANHPDNASRTIANIKAFLHSPCTKPHAKPSWAEQSKQLFNCPPNILLEDMNLQEWYELTGTMAVLVPLAGKCAQ